MSNQIGRRLLAALGAAAEEKLDPAHALVDALCAEDLTRARAVLGTLAPTKADALLTEAHRRMREDDAAVLTTWRPAGPHAN